MWRRLAKIALSLLAVLVVLIVIGELAGARVLGRLGRLAAEARPPIVVGLVHSLSGPLEPFERPIRDAELFAVSEINARGGIDGRLIKVVEADGRSDPRSFASQARKLIETDKATVLFGAWTSECRKAMRPVVEESNSILVFSGDFEGLERSSHVVYAGSMANQQVVPVMQWSVETLKVKKPMLLCLDEVWSRCAGAIARDQLLAAGVEAPAELVIGTGNDGVTAAIAAITKAQPDVIYNFTFGDTNTALFPALRRAKILSRQTPVISFRMSEDDGRRIVPEDLEGHYLASNYFSSLDLPNNREFLRRFKAYHGDDRNPSAPISNAYEAVHLWARAAAESIDASPERVLTHFPRISLDAAEGVITIDPEILAAWRPAFVGRARADGNYEVVWSIERPIRPNTYPLTRSNGEWNTFLDDLRAAWRGNWSGDGKTVVGQPPG